MTVVALQQPTSVERKAPSGKFRVIYVDPRGSEPTLDQDLDSLTTVRAHLQGKLLAERASCSVYDDTGRRITDFR